MKRLRIAHIESGSLIPDTFCLLQTRKFQIIELNAHAYFNNKTLEYVFRENYISNVEHDITTSTLPYLSLLYGAFVLAKFDFRNYVTF